MGGKLDLFRFLPCTCRVPRSGFCAYFGVFGVLENQQLTCYQWGLGVRIPPAPPTVSKHLHAAQGQNLIPANGIAVLTFVVPTQTPGDRIRGF
jgi:hypothetical protein